MNNESQGGGRKYKHVRTYVLILSVFSIRLNSIQIPAQAAVTFSY